jgi:hypothetical protein
MDTSENTAVSIVARDGSCEGLIFSKSKSVTAGQELIYMNGSSRNKIDFNSNGCKEHQL